MRCQVELEIIPGATHLFEEPGALMLLLQAKATRQERWLRERYPEYRDYEQRVKRFVPCVW